MEAVRILARAMPVTGIGTTAAMRRPDLDVGATVDAIARLVEAALGDP